MKKFVTRPSSCGRFRALVSHHGYVIGTPSFICASQMVSLSPPHLICQHLICQSFLLPFSCSSCLNCHVLIKLRPFPCPHLTSWLCHWHPILYNIWASQTAGLASLSFLPHLIRQLFLLPSSCSSCLNCHIDRYHQFLRGCFYVFVSAPMSSTR